MTDISIIMVSYNTREMTLASLRSVYEQSQDLSFEVIVVDNYSNDNSAAAIEECFPDVQLIKSEINLGFAGANNLAAKKADGAYLLLLNPDTVVLDGAIQNLYTFACKKPDNRLYGGRTLFGNHSLNPTSCWKRPTLWSIFCYATGLSSLCKRNPIFDPESYGAWQRDSVREVDIVTGCFLMIEKNLWDRLGGFDSRFFMYGEDADLCLRAAKEGARPIITPDATIVHYCGASEKVHVDKMVRLLRAKEQLIKRHWNPLSGRIGITLLRCAVLSRILACSLMNAIAPRLSSKNAESWRIIWQRRKEWQIS